MNKKIYWYCFKRQCREFYELLVIYKLILCELEEFIAHFTGKKFYDDDILLSGKITWYGSKEVLKDTFKYLAGKGFIDEAHCYSQALEEHFKFSAAPVTINNNYLLSLNALFPETTGYRCKTRLYYRERNKKPVKISSYVKN